MRPIAIARGIFARLINLDGLIHIEPFFLPPVAAPVWHGDLRAALISHANEARNG